MSSKHSILLIQFSGNTRSRTFEEYDTVSEAMNGVCQLYENQLKRLNPNREHITYDVDDLFAYIDGLADLSVLVFEPNDSSYTPHGRKWIKGRVLRHLRRIAGQ